MPGHRLEFPDAVRSLQAGGVLILPTDTLPGFHALVDDPEAVRRIALIKGRSEGKPLLGLAADLDQAQGVLGKLTSRQLVLARACWPGPFTLILPAASSIPDLVTACSGTLGVRVPDCEELRAMLTAVGRPLVSTSCNRQGDPPVTQVDQAVAAFAREVDGFWAPPQKADLAAAPGRPSALVDLVSWPPRVLREGPKPLPPTA